eukprot:TRINITY_DN37865_c0_g1_i1.p1 TRINITY_DN37865_c0_g1~~TRINITY_DN37865_c0_g1_i1.p1  ORF type:complete len:864 (+),score=129.65 TRINITY_DN37865_c0_g1_i1:207-2798(+)
MAVLFGLFGAGADKATKPVYSIEHLQHLYTKLKQLNHADEQNRDALIEVIRQVTEALIWGERHDQNFFDFFCEKNMLSDFVQVLNKEKVGKTVKVQLLQTLSMLVQNVRRETSLYYLFSNNYVNQLISTKFDWNHEELLGYYISFLKSLALRLNAETVKFFFNERAEQFSLYIEGVKFFCHRDVMVRAAVRTLTLQVYKIEDQAMKKFVLERSSGGYFVHLACYLRELWYRLDKVSRGAGGASGDNMSSTMQEVHEEQQDLMLYLSDVLDLEVPSLSEVLAEKLLRYAIFPVVLGSLLSDSPSSADDAALASPVRGQSSATGTVAQGGHKAIATSTRWLTPACALFALHQVVDTFRTRALLGPLVKALLRHKLLSDVQECCLGQLPPPPPTYRGSVFSETCSSWAPSETSTGRGAKVDLDVAGWFTRATADEERADFEGDLSMKSCLLAHLGSTDGFDSCALMVTGILRHCLLNREKMLPVCTDVTDGVGSAPSKIVSAGSLNGCTPLEALIRVVQALECHASQAAGHRGLRLVVVYALASFALDLASEVAARGLFTELHTKASIPAKIALQAASRQVQSHLRGLGDSFLDVFAEEWEVHHGPAIDVQDACSSVRCLWPAGVAGSPGLPIEWALPAAHSERQHAAKAIRCLLIIQGLYKGLLEGRDQTGTDQRIDDVSLVGVQKTADATQPAVGTSPLRIAGEFADGYKEGRSFELGRRDRIVCRVMAASGPQARYLILHKFLLLLVTPDVVPGMGVVKTLAPLRQVEAQIDQSDERTLRLAIRLPKGAACPGEASCYDPATCEPGFRLHPEEQRCGSSFTLTLSFEDPKRCRSADDHVRENRRKVRADLKRRMEGFIEELCS